MQLLTAPAKLTVSLRVTGVRPDGYHLLDAEMVSIDLADSLEIAPADDTVLEVVDEVVGGLGLAGLDTSRQNLVSRALDVVGRPASVRLHKRIPVGAGLGGGSSDAAAVLRWAGRRAPDLAATLGADVPFCVVGGRARVRGIGERVEPLAYVRRAFALLLPPIAVDTAAVYRAWDEGWRPDPSVGTGNDLEPAALAVEPRLIGWRDALSEVCGRPARLAGSGAAWFVESDDQVLENLPGVLSVDGVDAPLVAAWTVRPPAPDAPLPPRGAGANSDR